MKKTILTSLCMALCLTLTSCGARDNKKDSEQSKESNVIESGASVIESVTAESTINESDTEESTNNESDIEEPTSDLSNASVGSHITFGTYSSTPIEWRVLAIEDGKELIITNDVLFIMPYNDEAVATTWEGCTLRAYLNGDFYNTAFNDSEKSKIITTKLVNNNHAESGSVGGNDTEDSVFLLSLEDVNTYFNDDNDREAYFQGSNAWWLRSHGYHDEDATCVRDFGKIEVDGYLVDSEFGVRPALWINIE